MQVGLACLKFAGEHIGRFDRDLPHPVLRPGSVSHEPYAEPGGGLPCSGSRTFTQRAAVSYRFPAPEPRLCRHWAARFASRCRPRAGQGDRHGSRGGCRAGRG